MVPNVKEEAGDAKLFPVYSQACSQACSQAIPKLFTTDEKLQRGMSKVRICMNRNSDESAKGLKWRMLQGADGIRSWKSPDETRQCVLCERIFTGHEVRLLYDAESSPHLSCPTMGCTATPAQWIHPGNPLVSAEAWRDWVSLLDTLCEGPSQHRPGQILRKGNTRRLTGSTKRLAVAS